MPSLKLGLAHLAIAHKQPKANRTALLALLRQAGEQGVQLVAGPELSISGYAFTSYQDMAPYAETVDGPTLTGVAELCRTFGFYACIGLAERDEPSGILHNSAFLLDPRGHLVCRYRKINAESRWACPGDPTRDNTCATPWGRIGLLICSDSYHSLIPRVTALRGADLLLVVANWPPTGLDPLEIWRARALENGMAVVACNRTGQDLSMDCHQAPSVLIDNQGDVLLLEQKANSTLLLADLPLTDQGLLPSRQRQQRMAGRRIGEIHTCYLNRNGINDFTTFLQLPPPGMLPLWCHSADSPQFVLDSLVELQGTTANLGGALHILPQLNYRDADLVHVQQWCMQTGGSALLAYSSDSEQAMLWFAGAEGAQRWPWPRQNEPTPALPSGFDCGPARIHVLFAEALLHPELILACAKQGADLVVILADHFDTRLQLLGGARTIDQAAVAVCSPRGAGVWMPPEGHERWAEVLATPRERCGVVLDTCKTRQKRFQDRIDFHTLLRGFRY